VARTKREVIVVLTPHVVPLEDKSFSYVIPKDSDTFDTFGYQLFRNAYRIRNRDVFDLRFVYESEVFQQLVAAVRARAEVDGAIRNAEPYKSLIAGIAPGEEILVRRMMWEIIRKLRSADAIEASRMIFFQPSPEDAQSTDFVLSFLDRSLAQRGASQNALVLTFDAASRGTAEHPFVQPKALVSYINVTKETYEKELIARNTRNPDGSPKQWSIILSDQSSSAVPPIDILRAVLVLKRLLALNSTLPLTIKDFRVGRQIIFPTEQDISQTFHVIDRDAARLFYEVMQYYRAFEQQFNAETRAIAERIRQ
ncbi:MAG TPA: hypothetical protein VFL80_02410, partial [Thermoanaerobaculia bacterium]|nr:hypothetical protein [Thermoanaerobaculia bacterium]